MTLMTNQILEPKEQESNSRFLAEQEGGCSGH